MLRLTRQRQFRISNRTAILAALVLVVSAAAGMGDRFDDRNGARPALASGEYVNAAAAEKQPPRIGTTQTHKKGFKVSLYLFRRN
jgi:hypothetical protein